MKYCSSCGAQNGDAAQFCTACGAKFEAPAPANIAKVANPRPRPQSHDSPPAVQGSAVATTSPQAGNSSSKPYYYVDNENQPVGPHTVEELAHLERQGQITGTTLVASDGDSEWKPWQEINPVGAKHSQTPAEAPAPASEKPVHRRFSLVAVAAALAVVLLIAGVLAYVLRPHASRFTIKVASSDLQEVLVSVEGAKAYFNTSHTFVDPVVLRQSREPDQYDIEAVVAQVDQSRKPVIYNLPFGIGTTYKLYGRVKLFGHVMVSTTTSDPLVFLVQGPGLGGSSLRFVHCGGNGAVVTKDGTELWLSGDLTSKKASGSMRHQPPDSGAATSLAGSAGDPGSGAAPDQPVTEPVQSDYVIRDRPGAHTIERYKGSGGDVAIPNEINGLSIDCLGSAAFRDCPNVTSLIIPDTVTTIEDKALDASACRAIHVFASSRHFSSVDGILFNGGRETLIRCPMGRTGSVTIPGQVMGIADGAFLQCTGVTSVVIPEGVTQIGKEAFSYCAGLTNITMPGSVESIGQDALRGCSSLTSIAIPEGVTQIDGGAFRDCVKLASIKIPNQVFAIEDMTFQGCTSLTWVAIADGVTRIGGLAFKGCTGLTSVVIPNSLNDIGEGAFRGCASLTSVSIPNSVLEIGNEAFLGCSGLTNVTIPDTVISIGAGAFGGCTSLKRVRLSKFGKSIADSAFEPETRLVER